jgi:NAD dependent epimerase/dehydratase
MASAALGHFDDWSVPKESENNMKKTLVTGSEGFIGSHLVEKLVEDGAAVKAFVLYNSFNSWGWLDTLRPEIKREIEVVTGDIRDAVSVRNAMKDCDQVFHLAALVGIPYSYQSPRSFVQTNVTGTLNVLQAALDCGLSKVIHTSTSETYGTAQYVPIDEKHPLCGQSPYAASKIAADQIAYSFYCSFELPVVIVRPFNTYGPRQSARAIISTIISQISSGKTKISIGDTRPTRDFSYVLDTIEGFLSIASSPNAVGETINLGSNFEISIGTLAQLIAEVMNREVKIVKNSSRLRPENSEVMRLCANNGKVFELTGWQPKFGGREGLARGLKLTADWLSDPENLKAYKPNIYNI